MSPSLKVAVGKGEGYRKALRLPQMGNASFSKVRCMEGPTDALGWTAVRVRPICHGAWGRCAELSICDFPSDSPDAGHAGAEFLKAKPQLKSPK